MFKKFSVRKPQNLGLLSKRSIILLHVIPQVAAPMLSRVS